MAIYCNTLEGNMQYVNDPYCFTPSMYARIVSKSQEHVNYLGPGIKSIWLCHCRVHIIFLLSLSTLVLNSKDRHEKNGNRILHTSKHTLK